MARNNPSPREQVFLSAYSPSNKHKAKAAQVLLNLPNDLNLMKSEGNLAGWLWYAVRVAHMNKGVSQAEFVANLGIPSVDSEGNKQKLCSVTLDPADPYNSLDLQAWLKYLGFGGSRVLPQKGGLQGQVPSSVQHAEDQDRVMEFFGINIHYEPKGKNPHQLKTDYSFYLAAATQGRNKLPGHVVGNTAKKLSLHMLMYYYDGWYNSFLPLAKTVWEKQQDWIALLAAFKGDFYRGLGPVAYSFSHLLALANIPADTQSVNLAHDLLTDTAKRLTDGTLTYQRGRVTFCGDVSDFASDLKRAWNLANQHLSGGVADLLNSVYARRRALGILDTSPEGIVRVPLSMLERAGNDGNADAMLELGGRYRSGTGEADLDLETAISWYTKASKKEPVQAEAFYQLGKCALDLVGDPDSNRSKARSFMDNAVALNHPGAKVWVGLDCEKTDPDKAFRLFEQAANQMDPEGMYHLGRCFEEGIGTDADEKAAISRYRAAVNQGCSEAKLALALCLPKGEQCGFLTKEAEELLQQLVDDGDARAMCELADEYSGIWEELHKRAANITHDSQDRKTAEEYRSKAEQLYRRSIDGGYTLAWLHLGDHLSPVEESCFFSAPLKDYRDALECYRKAGEAGHAKGYYNIGWVLSYNRGLHRMPNGETMGYFRKAADMGHVQSMFLVALHDLEHGVQNDGDEPLYYRMADAASMGHDRAKLLTQVFEDHYPGEWAADWSGFIAVLQQGNLSWATEWYALAYCYLQRAQYGSSSVGDTKAALRYLEMAAREGSKLAMCELYEQTREEDPAGAMDWLQTAAREGSYLAMRKMYFATCDSDPDGAAAWLRKAADAGDYGSGVALECLQQGREVRFHRDYDDSVPLDITDEERAFLDEMDEEED